MSWINDDDINCICELAKDIPTKQSMKDEESYYSKVDEPSQGIDEIDYSDIFGLGEEIKRLGSADEADLIDLMTVLSVKCRIGINSTDEHKKKNRFMVEHRYIF